MLLEKKKNRLLGEKKNSPISLTLAAGRTEKTNYLNQFLISEVQRLGEITELFFPKVRVIILRVSVICHYAEHEAFIKMWLPHLTSKLE